MDDRQALARPTLLDPSKSLIENLLDLSPLAHDAPDSFTNTRPLWHPPSARGIFVGITIAQCFNAAQLTIPDNFVIHSMHCSFVFAGNSNLPIKYQVERVRDGKSFITRNVRAMQNGNPIFTTTMSFAKTDSGEKRLVEHAEPMPSKIPVPEDDNEDALGPKGGTQEVPYINKRVGIVHMDSPNPHKKRTHQWVKACGKISSSGGRRAHFAALSYMSDSYFIGVIPRVHNIWRFARPPLTELTDSGSDVPLSSKLHDEIIIPQGKETHTSQNQPVEVGMMVSLNHTMFFHNPQKVKADEWMLTELESHWAGDGRGLAYQKIWTKDGTLIASCIQEVITLFEINNLL